MKLSNDQRKKMIGVLYERCSNGEISVDQREKLISKIKSGYVIESGKPNSVPQSAIDDFVNHEVHDACRKLISFYNTKKNTKLSDGTPLSKFITVNNSPKFKVNVEYGKFTATIFVNVNDVISVSKSAKTDEQREECSNLLQDIESGVAKSMPKSCIVRTMGGELESLSINAKTKYTMLPKFGKNGKAITTEYTQINDDVDESEYVVETALLPDDTIKRIMTIVNNICLKVLAVYDTKKNIVLSDSSSLSNHVKIDTTSPIDLKVHPGSTWMPPSFSIRCVNPIISIDGVMDRRVCRECMKLLKDIARESRRVLKKDSNTKDFDAYVGNGRSIFINGFIKLTPEEHRSIFNESTDCSFIKYDPNTFKDEYEKVVNVLYERCSNGEISVDQREKLIDMSKKAFLTRIV